MVYADEAELLVNVVSRLAMCYVCIAVFLLFVCHFHTRVGRSHDQSITVCARGQINQEVSSPFLSRLV